MTISAAFLYKIVEIISKKHPSLLYKKIFYFRAIFKEFSAELQFYLFVSQIIFTSSQGK